MTLPRYIFISYYALLDEAMVYFFQDMNDSFIKLEKENGRIDYIFAESHMKLRQYFNQIIPKIILSKTKPFDMFNQKYYFIIDDCSPKDNIYLKNASHLPKKLAVLLAKDLDIKYVLAESDIKLDLVTLNSIFDSYFDQMFGGARKRLGGLLADRRNVFFVRNSSMDYTMVKKVGYSLFGRKYVDKIQLNEHSQKKKQLININCVLSRYVEDKNSLKRSDEYKLIEGEVRQYLSACVDALNGEEQTK